MKKILYLLFFSTLFTNIFADDDTNDTEESQLQNSIVDKEEGLTDKETLTLQKIDNASLVGNLVLATDCYRDLIKSFIATDKQSSVINYSLDLIPKFLIFQDYTFVSNLLDHLSYRVQYYSRSSEKQKTTWTTQIQWYKILVFLLQKNIPENSQLPNHIEVPEISSNLDKANISLVLQEFVLGLTSTDNIDNQFQHLYQSLDMTNQLHKVELYYIISITLVRIYLAKQEYMSAITRLNVLYDLFSTIQPSDYYRIKVLFYFTQIFLAKHQIQDAYTAYLRARDMLLFNTVISQQESERLQALLDSIKGQFSEINNRNANSFMNDFLQAGDY